MIGNLQIYMLSILIPVYNQDVVALVDDLAQQCDALGILYQILVFDDCSLPEWKSCNDSLHGKINVNYLELSENYGRSRIRNKLVQMSRFDKLLFLDGDSKIINNDFIKSYISHKDAKVIYGGTYYAESCPDTKVSLHWSFGKNREALKARDRLKNPWESFKTNNFFALKEVFSSAQFDESVTKYGYEDSVFAHELQKKGIDILHIDNRVEHTGLTENESFLKKTELSIENLVMLIASNKLKATKLARTWQKLDNFGFWHLPTMFLVNIENKLKVKLISSNNLTNFNLWKLLVFNRNKKSLPEIR